MALTLEELDQLLNHWEKQIKKISQIFEELNIKQKIVLNREQFVGVTNSELKTVLAQANEIIPYFADLEKMYQATVSTRQTIQPWGGASIIEETIQKLTSQSLVLSLGKFSPTRLLEHLIDSLERVKTLLREIDNTIVSNKNDLERSSKELILLQQINPANQVENKKTIEDIKAAIATCGLILEQDPLGIKNQIEEQVLVPLTQLGKNIQYLIQEKTRLQQELAARYPLLEELRQVHEQALIVYTQNQHQGLLLPETMDKPLTSEDLEALTLWWKRLKSKLAEGWIIPVKVGLVNWTKNVQRCITKEHQICQVSYSIYEEAQNK